MAIKDALRDLTTYVTGTGFFEKIKMTGNTKDTTIESMTKEKEVILKGKFKDPISDLQGEFGLSNLPLLQTITNDNQYSMGESSVEVVYENQAGGKVPTEFAYLNKSRSHINYRLMSKELLPEQPKFIEPKWDVVIIPTKVSIQQFAWAAGGLSAYEQYFIPKIVNGDLTFFIGEENAKTQRGGVVIASDLTETFESPHKWKIQHVQAVLKMSDACDCEMAFSTKGAIQIKLDSGLGTYKYIFPAKAR
jgi:hypothetical protein